MNKSVQYDVDISQREVKNQTPLPFPGITSRVMAAHNKRIYLRQSVRSTVVDLTESKHILEKFYFSIFRRALYETIFFLALFLSKTKWVPALKSYPTRDIELPQNITNLQVR